MILGITILAIWPGLGIGVLVSTIIVDAWRERVLAHSRYKEQLLKLVSVFANRQQGAKTWYLEKDLLAEMILIIPHVPHSYSYVRIRSLELAREFARLGHAVQCLTWAAPDGIAPRPRLTRIGDLLSEINVEQRDDLSFVRMPIASFGRILRFSKRLNAWRLNRWIRKNKIDLVINASALWWSVLARSPAFYVYDVVDDHVRQTSNYPRLDRAIGNHFDKECRKADLVIASSLEQVRLVEERVEVKPLYVPNGVDLAAYRSVTPAQVAEQRERLGLKDKWVIGYIGKHNYWSGVGFLLQVFDVLRRQCSDAHLLIVGGGVEVDTYAPERSDDPDVTFLGLRPVSEMPLLFNLIDVGVLPFRCIPFTDSALPLKILEYGASRKQVVASPLRELQNHRFPYVELVPEDDVHGWVAALQALRQREWRSEWDHRVDQFDWRATARKLIAEIEARR